MFIAKRCLLSALIIVLSSSALAVSKFQGYAERGGQTVITNLTGSSVSAQRSFPLCLINVYVDGTTTPAVIYSDSAGTVLIPGGQFSSDSVGHFQFWGNSSAYSVKFSPVGYVPWTITGFSIGGSGGGGSTGTLNIMASPYNAVPGTSDSAAAITAALSDASAAGGGIVTCPPGNFSVSTITINTSNPVTLTGGCTLTQFTANALSPVISIIKPNVTIDGLTITGSVAAGHESDDGTADILLTFSGSTLTLDGITIRNCHLLGKNTGIESYLGNASGFKFTNLKLINNVIRTIYRGIEIGPYAQNAVVNKNITAEDNDIEVSAGAGAPGVYANIVYARPMQIINTDTLLIRHNRAIGGFSGIETYGGTGATSPRPREHDVHITDNITDGHIGFTQVTGGDCSHNTVDLSLRDSSWLAYDSATVVAAWGYLPGIEAADITGCTINGNSVYNQVGAGIQYGASESCTVSGNIVVNSSNTATPWTDGHAIMLYNHIRGGAISGNTLSTGKMSGIGQDDTYSYDDIARTSITGNTIDSFQRSGIAIHNTAGGNGDLVISNNVISNINLAASTYSGIDFTPVFGGSDLIRGMQVTGNLIDGGKYAIYQPYFETTEVRGVLFINNQSRNATTAAYLCYGRRSHNTLGAGGVITVGLTGGHLDTRNLADDIYLDPGGAASFTAIDNATENDTVSINFQRADTLVTNSGVLQLQGGANVTPTIGSIMVFKCVLSNNPVGQVWTEVSRSIR